MLQLETVDVDAVVDLSAWKMSDVVHMVAVTDLVHVLERGSSDFGGCSGLGAGAGAGAGPGGPGGPGPGGLTVGNFGRSGRLRPGGAGGGPGRPLIRESAFGLFGTRGMMGTGGPPAAAEDADEDCACCAGGAVDGDGFAANDDGWGMGNALDTADVAWGDKSVKFSLVSIDLGSRYAGAYHIPMVLR